MPRSCASVTPPETSVPKQAGFYFLLDGHLRIEALKDLGAQYADCLVATDDDTYSYNKRINRLSAVQDHKMIFQAIGLSGDDGVGVSCQCCGEHMHVASVRQLQASS